jgi:hypothetical protein
MSMPTKIQRGLASPETIRTLLFTYSFYMYCLLGRILLCSHKNHCENFGLARGYEAVFIFLPEPDNQVIIKCIRSN